MSTETVVHYQARLFETADLYQRDPSTDSAWALIRALALSRLHRVPPVAYEPVISALAPHEADILQAALSSALDQDYAALVDDFAEGANHDLEEWEHQPDGFVFLHFELQAAHDWVADRVLQSEALLPSLINPLDNFGSATAKLAAAIRRHESLFRVALKLHHDLLAEADQALLTSAYRLWEPRRAATGFAHSRRQEPAVKVLFSRSIGRLRLEPLPPLALAAASDPLPISSLPQSESLTLEGGGTLYCTVFQNSESKVVVSFHSIAGELQGKRILLTARDEQREQVLTTCVALEADDAGVLRGTFDLSVLDRKHRHTIEFEPEPTPQ